jgi:hypothetical protein
MDARAHWGKKHVKAWCDCPSPSRIYTGLDWKSHPLETTPDIFNTGVPFWWENKELPPWTALSFGEQ